MSLLGGVGELAAVTTWYLLYYFNWGQWGVFGETMALVRSWGM
jgi:hypothetical protein